MGAGTAQSRQGQPAAALARAPAPKAAAPQAGRRARGGKTAANITWSFDPNPQPQKPMTQATLQQALSRHAKAADNKAQQQQQQRRQEEEQAGGAAAAEAPARTPAGGTGGGRWQRDPWQLPQQEQAAQPWTAQAAATLQRTPGGDGAEGAAPCPSARGATALASATVAVSRALGSSQFSGLRTGGAAQLPAQEAMASAGFAAASPLGTHRSQQPLAAVTSPPAGALSISSGGRMIRPPLLVAGRPSPHWQPARAAARPDPGQAVSKWAPGHSAATSRAGRRGDPVSKADRRLKLQSLLAAEAEPFAAGASTGRCGCTPTWEIPALQLHSAPLDILCSSPVLRRRWEWLLEPRDQQLRPPSDPDHDPTTLHIPPGAWGTQLKGADAQYWRIKQAGCAHMVLFFQEGELPAAGGGAEHGVAQLGGLSMGLSMGARGAERAPWPATPKECSLSNC